MKGLYTQDIHGELVDVLGSDGIGHSTVTKYLWQSQIPPFL
jgi:hypothetical protein